MAEKRDYYEVLGLSKGASADEIKGAYRKAALKWHPDRWVDGSEAEKKTAEEKFKEASEAYSVLSDPDKKAKYDQFGFAGMGDMGGFDFSQGFGGGLDDLLKNLFGGGFGGFSGGGFGGFGGFGGGFGGGGGSSQKVSRGRDIRTRVKLTLEEIASGCTKTITLERNRTCSECGGRGTKNSSDVKTCPTCKGSGQVSHVTNSIFGRTMTYNICPQCGGEGKIISNPCRSCGGTGVMRKKENVTVNIPAGVENGVELRVRGEGHTGQHNGVNGDLLIVIEELEHPDLKREGNNLFFTKVISVTDAILGCDIAVPCLGGAQTVRLDPGTQSGTVIKLRGKGLGTSLGFQGKGDLYIKVIVWIPRKVRGKEKDLIEELAKSSSVTPDPTREDKALFEKESKYF